MTFTCAALAFASYLAGIITMWVRRDDRLRSAEESCMAATTEAASRAAECQRLRDVRDSLEREVDALVREKRAGEWPKGAA